MFKCQENSYLAECETVVTSCDLYNELKNESKQYVLTLKDTILFPEGGGQPSDDGWINGIPVSNIKRKGNEAYHYIEKSFEVGEKVSVTLNWQKRFDHMQQHTGQHLITAVAEDMFGFKTSSWNLGETVSFIELDTPVIKKENFSQLEEKLNEKVRECIPVTVNLYSKGSPELSSVRTRLELPDDHYGPVRVVTIEGIDNNTCCGTHVRNTSELQVIKLLYAEKGKKNKMNLHFIAGNRVLQYTEASVIREKSLNTLLGCKSAEIVDRVQKLQNSLKSERKSSLSVLKDLAKLEAQIFKLIIPKPKVFFVHKKNIESDFITYFLSEVNDDNDVIFFVSVENGNSGGQFTLSGPKNIVQEYGPKICDVLDAKGSGKADRYQGKFRKKHAVEEVQNVLKSVGS